MNPTNLGKQNGALVLEVLKVLGRPSTSFEVAERVADVYKLPLQPIRPVVTDVLEGGVCQGSLAAAVAGTRWCSQWSTS